MYIFLSLGVKGLLTFAKKYNFFHIKFKQASPGQMRKSNTKVVTRYFLQLVTL